jgi:nucleoside-diphosphate-sugar epimerase
MLREAGHEVVEISRRAGVDGFDRAALARAMDPQPDVVVQQLTALPAEYKRLAMEEGVRLTNRLRTEGTRNLAEAAPGARLISQSITFQYRPKERLHVEGDELWTDGPGQLPEMTAALIEMESLTVERGGVVLRYGYFYGPRTWYSREGSMGKELQRRRLPIIGGRGVFSFCHVEDAAGAVLPALERGSGVYNICDDDPAPVSEWLPAFAEAIGAPKPLRVPRLVGRAGGGAYAVAMFDEFQGASNERAKQELGWQPRHPSWRGVLGRE